MIWKDVKGYGGKYQVSDCGQVRNTISDKILVQTPQRQGYLRVNLYREDGTYKTCYVHRLVASAFIENPHNLPQINHIDEIKSNNSVRNLEWVTPKQNVNHGTGHKRGADALKKPVVQLSKAGEFLREFDSIISAGTATNNLPENICRCCKGKLKTAYGFRWKYATGGDELVLPQL